MFIFSTIIILTGLQASVEITRNFRASQAGYGTTFGQWHCGTSFLHYSNTRSIHLARDLPKSHTILNNQLTLPDWVHTTAICQQNFWLSGGIMATKYGNTVAKSMNNAIIQHHSLQDHVIFVFFYYYVLPGMTQLTRKFPIALRLILRGSPGATALTSPPKDAKENLLFNF